MNATLDVRLGTIEVLGVDLSLTSTGWAWLATRPNGATEWETRTIRSAAARGVAPTVARLDRIASAVCEAGGGDPDLVVIEGPSFSSHTGSAHERGGLWWLVARTFAGRGVPVAVVSPAARCKYATGKGNAGKDAVLAAVVRRYPDVEVEGNDVADAVVLAAMGARQLGRPVDSLPVLNLAALAKVDWPEPSP